MTPTDTVVAEAIRLLGGDAGARAIIERADPGPGPHPYPRYEQEHAITVLALRGLAETAAKDRDIQALRGELAILMEVVEALPEELLDEVPEAKLLRAYQAMTEADKHKHMDTVIDRQAAEIASWKKRFQLVNEALRRRLVKGGDTP